MMDDELEMDYRDELSYEDREGRSHPTRDPKLVIEFLGQREMWNSRGGYIPIADMTPSHAQATVMFLLKRSPGIAFAAYLGGDDIPWSEILDGVKAREWMWNQPLVQALIERATEPQENGLRPWQRAAQEIKRRGR